MVENNIIKALLEFTKEKNIKIFYAKEFPDIANVVVWDASKGDVSKFLSVFRDYEIRDPVLVGDWGACIPLGSLHYCYLVDVERGAGETSKRVYEEEFGEAEVKAPDKAEALAEELIGELLKNDPRELARNIVSRLRSKGIHALRTGPLAVREQLRDYVMKSKKVEGLGERELERLEFELDRKLGWRAQPKVRDFIENFEEEFNKEVSRILAEERKKRLEEALEVCLKWLRGHRILRPRRGDIERCVIENKLDLSLAEKDALYSAIKEKLRLR